MVYGEFRFEGLSLSRNLERWTETRQKRQDTDEWKMP